MTEISPDKKVDKQKRTQKKVKKKALKDFLQKSEISQASSDLVSTIFSDQQQKVQTVQKNNCYLCMVDLGDKKKFCGFCNMPACSDHMRKKRKNRQINKNVRICDDCEDRYLYSKYMKLQLKNQESLTVQESIIQAQRDQLESSLKVRRDKLSALRKKQNQMLSKHKQKQNNAQEQINKIKVGTQEDEKKRKELQDLEKQIKSLQQKIPAPLQDDYRVLQIELQKVKKQNLRFQKLCSQAAKSKTKRQKQILEQYNKWQQTERQKLKTQSEQTCIIF